MWKTENYKHFPSVIPHNDIGVKNNLYCSVLEQNHVVIAGATGSGKSVFLDGLMYAICQGYRGAAQVLLCDPKRVDLRKYKDLPFVFGYSNTDEDMYDAIKEMHSVMMKRYAVMESKGQVKTDEADIYIIIDELSDLLDRKDGDKSRGIKNYGTSIKSLLVSICRLGRAAKVHCIMATQKPSKKVLSSELLANVTCTVALHCKDAFESKIIIDESGAEDLPKYGKCLVKIPEGMYKQDVHMYSEDELEEIIHYFDRFKCSSFKANRSRSKNGIGKRIAGRIAFELKEALSVLNFLDIAKIAFGTFLLVKLFSVM